MNTNEHGSVPKEQFSVENQNTENNDHMLNENSKEGDMEGKKKEEIQNDVSDEDVKKESGPSIQKLVEDSEKQNIDQTEPVSEEKPLDEPNGDETVREEVEMTEEERQDSETEEGTESEKEEVLEENVQDVGVEGKSVEEEVLIKAEEQDTESSQELPEEEAKKESGLSIQKSAEATEMQDIDQPEPVLEEKPLDESNGDETVREEVEMTEEESQDSETEEETESEKEEVLEENVQDTGVEGKSVEEEVLIKAEELDTESSQELPEEEAKKETKDSEDEIDGVPGKEKKEEKKERIRVDYNTLGKQQLVDHLEMILADWTIEEIGEEPDKIKNFFYKKHKAEIEEKKKQFLDEGGQIQDFKPFDDGWELKLKELLSKVKNLKTASNRKLEEEKETNLREKYKIIEEIKELINADESLHKTFQDFRQLQQQWRSIGLVPQQYVNDLWETYHHHVERFYDYIKINKELRDLDLKKNMEAKIGLCEKTEELLLEPNIVEAFKILQKYHDQWREIGPVPREKKAQLWERFKATTTKINKKHQEYFQGLKEEQKKNLEAKRELCEKVEEINALEIDSHQEWEEKSSLVIELQKMWKTIGFAPKKDNNKIYSRFRKACDDFFDRKREFYSKNKELQTNNLQLKTDLCVQAEALANSTDWKKTSHELIGLQKKWKEIGPVPKKHSDIIWKRFRAACDQFFNNKTKYFSNIDKEYDKNLELKEQLIEEIEKLDTTEGKVDIHFEKLKDYQRKWTEIGFVPYDKKDEIANRYRAAINRKFDSLKLDEFNKSVLRFQNKLDNLTHKPKGDFKINQEREKFINKIKQLENDIVLWENNIGFFAKSKNADSMINEVKTKIINARKRISLLEEKINMIDDIDEEENNSSH